MNRNLISLVLICSIYQQLNALPTGFSKVAGRVKQPYIDQSGALVIESGKRAVIEWDRFSVETQETLRFAQKDANSAILNRVTGQDLSSILGTLTSNGKVFVINPNGIMIGESGLIQTAGFIASTANITSSDFMKALPLQLNNFSKGTIVNLGKINALSGDVGLFARAVRNDGTISAPQGSVYLGAGPQILLQPEGEQHLFISLDNDSDFSPNIENNGLIEALSVEIKTASNVYEKAISLGGKINASQLYQEGNKVYLKADSSWVEVSGEIIADGGLVSIQGQDVHLTKNSKVDVSSSTGNAGKIDLDAINICAYEGEVLGEATGLSGDGGYLKLTGSQLYPNGRPNFLSRHGKTGMINLDPKFLNVNQIGGDTEITFCAEPLLSDTTNILGAAVAVLLLSGDVTLQATTDITITANITQLITNNNLILQAGRSVFIAPGIITPTVIDLNGGGFSATINYDFTPCTGITPPTRDPGAATFAMTGGSEVHTGTDITVDVGNNGGVTLGSILIQDSLLQTNTTGSIHLTGYGDQRAGTGTPQSNGVFINGSTVETTAAGSGGIFITGTGTLNDSSNVLGVKVLSSSVSSADGPLEITGFGGGDGSGDSNFGIDIIGSSTLVTTGSNPITLTGTGGQGGDNNEGIEIADANTSITSDAGTITIMGTGTGTGELNFGISLIDEALVHSTNGSISLTGNNSSGSLTNDNYGINIQQSTIQSDATGAGKTLSLTGTGGTGSIFNIGIVMNNSAVITSVDADVSLTGTGQGTSNQNSGIQIDGGSQITVSGSGKIDFEGTGANGTFEGYGIIIDNDSILSTNLGNITITGTGGDGSSDFNDGIYMTHQARVTSQTGNITFDATAGAGVSDNIGLLMTRPGTTVSTIYGDILLTATSLGTLDANFGILLGGEDPVFRGPTIYSQYGSLTIDGTSGTGRNENIGVAITDLTELYAQNLISITGVGNSDGTGSSNYGVRVTNSTTIPASSIIPAPAPAPAPAFNCLDNTPIISAPIVIHGTGNGLNSNYGVVLSAGNLFATDADPITITGISNGTSTFNLGIFLEDAVITSYCEGNITLNGTGGLGVTNCEGIVQTSSIVHSNDGNISYVGIGNGAGENNDGIDVGTASQIEALGTGSIDLNGTGGPLVPRPAPTPTSFNFGIVITDTDTRVTATSGEVHLTGQGGNADGVVGNILNAGVAIANSAVISTDSGPILIEGTSGTGYDQNYGIAALFSAPQITSNSGDITLMGTSNGFDNNNSGIDIENNAVVSTGANGSITMTGNASTIALNFNDGISIQNTSTVTSLDGPINLTGTGGTGQNGISNHGLALSPDSTISSTGIGSITILGNSGDGSSNNNGANIGGRINTVTGDIDITANGFGNNDANFGMLLFGSTVETTGSGDGNGNIFLTGTGGNGISNNHGITINQTSTVQTVDGNLTFNGTGQGTDFDNDGLYIAENSIIRSTGIGSIDITGLGASGTSSSSNGNDGLNFAFGADFSTNLGTITFTGTCQGQGGNQSGITMGQTSISTTSGTSIAITGTGSPSGNAAANIGISMGGVTIDGSTGGISIEGTGGQGDNFNFGIGMGQCTIRSDAVFPLVAKLEGNGNGTGTLNFGIGMQQTSISGSAALQFKGAASPIGSVSPNPGILIIGGTNIHMTTHDIDMQGTGTLGDPTANSGFFIDNTSSIIDDLGNINIETPQGDIIVGEPSPILQILHLPAPI